MVVILGADAGIRHRFLYLIQILVNLDTQISENQEKLVSSRHSNQIIHYKVSG